MSGAICGVCGEQTNNARIPKCELPECPGAANQTFAPMSEQRKQEHASVAVQLTENGEPCIGLRGARYLHDAADNSLMVTLPTLESAEALRDALSAFITFHRQVERHNARS